MTGGGTYEVVRRMCESGNEDSEAGHRAHPASWPDSSTGANLIVDRRALAYPVHKCERTRPGKVGKSGSVQHRRNVEGPQEEQTLETEDSDQRCYGAGSSASDHHYDVLIDIADVRKAITHTADLSQDEWFYHGRL